MEVREAGRGQWGEMNPEEDLKVDAEACSATEGAQEMGTRQGRGEERT